METFFTIVLPALIGGLVTLIGSVLTYRTSIKTLEQKREESHNAQLSELQKSLTHKLEEDRQEYLTEIQNVKDSMTDLTAKYQQTVAVIELKIDNLEKKQDKHNNVIERTYKLESEVELLKNREKVSEHRLSDLENDGK